MIPFAVFIGWQESVVPYLPLALYTICGGPYDKSTVSAARLRQLGIQVPPA